MCAAKDDEAMMVEIGSECLQTRFVSVSKAVFEVTSSRPWLDVHNIGCYGHSRTGVRLQELAFLPE